VYGAKKKSQKVAAEKDGRKGGGKILIDAIVDLELAMRKGDKLDNPVFEEREGLVRVAWRVIGFSCFGDFVTMVRCGGRKEKKIKMCFGDAKRIKGLIIHQKAQKEGAGDKPISGWEILGG